MKTVLPLAAAGLRRMPAALALIALALPAYSDVTAIIRHRSGDKDTVVAQKSQSKGTVTASTKRGTASSSAFATLTLPLVSTVEIGDVKFNDYWGPTFQAKAEGSNPKDTQPPAGRESDRLNTMAEVRFTEVMTVEGAAGFDLGFKLHGTVTAQGANGAGFARAYLQVVQAGDYQTFEGTSDAPGYFNGSDQFVSIQNLNPFLNGLVSYEARLFVATNTSIYKQNQAKADAGSTVTQTGITIRNASGKRIEAPDLMSQSGFDYSPILNVPTAGSGPGAFSFASEALSAQEDGGSLLVRINRDGGSDGTASVTVRNVTVPPVGTDFEPFSKTLVFAEGETQKAVAVKLINGPDVRDFFSTGSRTFEMELANATGAPLSPTSHTAAVTIYEDDSPWSAPDAGPQTLVARINPGGAAGETGLLTFSVNASGTGTFSGVLRGKRFAGSGTEGELNFIGGGKRVNVAGLGEVKFTLLRFKTIAGVARLMGMATLPDTTELAIRGVAVHTSEASKPKTSKRGRYTLLLEPPADADAAAPKGTGFAQATVLPSGKTFLMGRLADGTILTAGGTLNILAELPLLVSLPNKRGELSGVLRFRFMPEAGDLDGELTWTRPSSTTGREPFLDGFATTLTVVGSRFSAPPAGACILPALTSENQEAVFEAEGADLAASLIRQVSIGPAPRSKVTPETNSEKLSLWVLGQTGLWGGSFRDGTKVVRFQGAVLQSANRGGGYFLGPTQSGSVSLTPGTLAP